MPLIMKQTEEGSAWKGKRGDEEGGRRKDVMADHEKRRERVRGRME